MSLPSPISTPVTHDEGAQRIIDTITVLHQSLDLVVSPNPHGHALVKLLGQNFSDLVRLYQTTDNRKIVLQQQLDDANTKLLAQFEVQNAEILKIADQLKTTQAGSDFYRAKAIQAGVVPSIRRSRPISSDNEPLTQEQQSQQLSLAYTDIQVRDFALEQLQLQSTLLKISIDQVLTSSAETLSLHVSLLEQHMQLQARLKVCSSAVQHYRNQYLEYRHATDDQLSTCTAQLQELQEIQAKYDKLAAQVSTEDPLIQDLTSREDNQAWYTYYFKKEFRELRPYLWPDEEDQT